MVNMVVATAAYLVVVVGAVLVAFVGDPESSSPLGKVTWAVQVWLPVNLERAVVALPGGGAVAGCCRGTYDYACNKPNPLMQILYLALVCGGFIVFQLEATQHIPNRYLSEVHLYTSHLAVWITLMSFVWVCSVDPGFVTKETHAVFDHHTYDGFMYVKHDCKTCKLRKLARSKHCSICDGCVSKFDHHCPWINGCVGERNYRHFLFFLFSTMSLLIYSGWGVGYILLSIVEERNLFGRSFINRLTGERIEPSAKIVLTYLFVEKSLLVMLFVMSVIMGAVVGAFLGYHIYLICCGTTTNESAKWGNIKSYYREATRNGDFDEPRDAELEAEMLNPDTAPPLHKRKASFFPSTVPRNIYQHGMLGNFREVFFPASDRRFAMPKAALLAAAATSPDPQSQRQPRGGKESPPGEAVRRRAKAAAAQQ